MLDTADAVSLPPVSMAAYAESSVQVVELVTFEVEPSLNIAVAPHYPLEPSLIEAGQFKFRLTRSLSTGTSRISTVAVADLLTPA